MKSTTTAYIGTDTNNIPYHTSALLQIHDHPTHHIHTYGHMSIHTPYHTAVPSHFNTHLVPSRLSPHKHPSTHQHHTSAIIPSIIPSIHRYHHHKDTHFHTTSHIGTMGKDRHHFSTIFVHGHASVPSYAQTAVPPSHIHRHRHQSYLWPYVQPHTHPQSHTIRGL